MKLNQLPQGKSASYANENTLDFDQEDRKAKPLYEEFKPHFK